MSGVPGNPDAAAREAWAFVRQVNDAWTRADGSKLSEYFHPRMVAVVPNARERLVGGAACVAGWKHFAATVEIREWREIEPRVEVFGAAAVVTYEYELRGRTGGQEVVLKGRDMLTLAREEDRWWVVADQFSPFPE